MEENPQLALEKQKIPTVAQLARLTAIIDSHSIPASFNLLGAHQWKPPTFEARDLWLRCFKALWNVSPQKRCGLEVEELAVLSALLLHGKDVRAESLNGFIQAGLKLWKRCDESVKDLNASVEVAAEITRFI